MEFRELGISEGTLYALKKIGYIEPTEVQEKVVPLLLNKKDVFVRSQTGTGKTAAFGISLVELLIKSKDNKSLVLAPTRELALQICKELRSICGRQRINIFAIYGGQDIERQTSMIRQGFDIVIATPGRLLDHSRRGTLDLSEFKLVVLDEADRMLDMGFIDDIRTILAETSQYRTMMLFSATLSAEIKSLARDFMNDPELIEIGEEEKAPNIEEETIYVEKHEKFSALADLLKKHTDEKIMVFASTKRFTETLAKRLHGLRIKCDFLHGDLTQRKREFVLDGFKKGYFSVLVATDLASRGIHVDDVSFVINYDEANDTTTHTHRIGRTGRMGKAGKAITFVEKGQGEDYYSSSPRKFNNRSRGYQPNNQNYYTTKHEPRYSRRGKF